MKISTPVNAFLFKIFA